MRARLFRLAVALGMLTMLVVVLGAARKWA
jgi:hypothetical protein